MDPFVQQTVVYTPRNILVTSANPSVKRVNDLNTLSVSKQPTASMTLSEFANHILPWTNSIFDGVLTWNTSRVNFDSVKPVCLSRNCTWDAYPSLGVCASPSDVTSRLKVSSDGSIATLPSNKSLAGHDAYMRVEATWDLHQMGKSGEFILNDSTSTAFINTRNPIYHGSAIYVPNPLQTFVNPNQRR